jgi:hypothetical protein
MPDTFTWAVGSPTGAASYVSLVGYGPATTGSCGPVYYSRPVHDGNGNVIGVHWWTDHDFPGGLEARVTARAPLAHPGWSEEIVAQILEGVINDAGGLILLGGHIVRVPPRQPVEAILAALPGPTGTTADASARGAATGRRA